MTTNHSITRLIMIRHSWKDLTLYSIGLCYFISNLLCQHFKGTMHTLRKPLRLFVQSLLDRHGPLHQFRCPCTVVHCALSDILVDSIRSSPALNQQVIEPLVLIMLLVGDDSDLTYGIWPREHSDFLNATKFVKRLPGQYVRRMERRTVSATEIPRCAM